MGKKTMVYRLKKWFVIFLIFVLFFMVGKQQSYQADFWEVGKQVATEYFLKQVFYSQSVFWGFVQEMEFSVWSKEPRLVTESVWEYEDKNDIFYASEDIADKVTQENKRIMEGEKEEINFSQNPSFVPVTTKQVEIDFGKYATLESLIKEFYIIDSTTEATEELFEIEKLKSYDCAVDKSVEGPQILIYHTHSQEAFANSEAGKEEDTIMEAGAILASYLEEYAFTIFAITLLLILSTWLALSSS